MNIFRFDIHSNIFIYYIHLNIMRMQIRSSQDLGNLVAEARRQRQLTQRQVAKEIGVTQAWISKVERGQSKAWIGNVLRLAAFLDITLVGEIGSPSKVGTEPGAQANSYPDLNELI